MSDKHTLILMTAADTDAMLKEASEGSLGIGRFKNTTSFVLGSDAPPGQAPHDLIHNVLSESGKRKDTFRPGATFFDSLLAVPVPAEQVPTLEEKFHVIRVHDGRELAEARGRLHNEAREKLGVGRKGSGELGV